MGILATTGLGRSARSWGVVTEGDCAVAVDDDAGSGVDVASVDRLVAVRACPCDEDLARGLPLEVQLRNCGLVDAELVDGEAEQSLHLQVGCRSDGHALYSLLDH